MRQSKPERLGKRRQCVNIFEMLEALDKAIDEERDARHALWIAINNGTPPSEIASLQKLATQKRKASKELSDRVMAYIKNIEWLRRQNND